MDYNPQKFNLSIIKRAWDLIESVPYKVSHRWLFYRLFQEGFYKDKKDYKNKFDKLFSRARKSFYEGWTPNTMADETRERIIRTSGDCDGMATLENLAYKKFHIDHFFKQDYYVEIWYEARAMTAQFKYYTEDIDLVPFGGDMSIPFKWETAKHIEDWAREYEKPAVILYFGDHDKKGYEILEAAEKDIRKWCGESLEIHRIGLTQEQIDKYRLPEAIDKKGFQWEALTDEAAREIINSGLDLYVDKSIIEEAKKESQKLTDRWREKIEGIIEEWY